ncbi:MAG: ssDNA-binding protein, mitochondrial [Heterodermia speciosa]|uniref:SsDNA-binding protein, mitochondrial n=1 Tax=Heterodermia speciosa TaxID=116794 RepID=A0A8H3FIT9_9LECA|nr:MAG: ssDNA-binding protein, mitochondrial [Heterodermia speciosa]
MSLLLRRPLPLSSLRPSPLSLPSRTLSTTAPLSIAKITIVGRLASRPEEVATSNGAPLIRYALATNTGPKDNRQTSWWKVALFAQNQGLRDVMMGLGKGSLLFVEGEASMRKFVNSENKEQQALSIIQRQVDVLEKRSPETEDEGEGEGEAEAEAEAEGKRTGV